MIHWWPQILLQFSTVEKKIFCLKFEQFISANLIQKFPSFWQSFILITQLFKHKIFFLLVSYDAIFQLNFVHSIIKKSSVFDLWFFFNVFNLLTRQYYIEWTKFQDVITGEYTIYIEDTQSFGAGEYTSSTYAEG